MESSQSGESNAAFAACRKALEAIAPCVVGWPKGEEPQWVKPLMAVVPDLQAVLGIPQHSDGQEETP